jgi:NAD-dependent SIR2 family protein deacetylase
MITLETKTKENNIMILGSVPAEEELIRCRECGKLFKPYTVRMYGQELDSTICKKCRSKYS